MLSCFSHWPVGCHTPGTITLQSMPKQANQHTVISDQVAYQVINPVEQKIHSAGKVSCWQC